MFKTFYLSATLCLDQKVCAADLFWKLRSTSLLLHLPSEYIATRSPVSGPLSSFDHTLAPSSMLLDKSRALFYEATITLSVLSMRSQCLSCPVRLDQSMVNPVLPNCLLFHRVKPSIRSTALPASKNGYNELDAPTHSISWLNHWSFNILPVDPTQADTEHSSRTKSRLSSSLSIPHSCATKSHAITGHEEKFGECPWYIVH
ncbi:hypothetical protein BDR22DRAFT_5289 [Usnea florida]